MNELNKYFQKVEQQILFEWENSNKPFSINYFYKQEIDRKTMGDHPRFAVR